MFALARSRFLAHPSRNEYARGGLRQYKRLMRVLHPGVAGRLRDCFLHSARGVGPESTFVSILFCLAFLLPTSAGKVTGRAAFIASSE
jgi:hypothetical protein